MSVHLSTPLLNDELTWIRRLEKLRDKKLLTTGQFRFRYLHYTVTQAAGNDRGRGRAVCWFPNLSARQNTTTSESTPTSMRRNGLD
jgi:hypothetical protein